MRPISLLALLALSTPALAWPGLSDWQPLTHGGAPVTDVADDNPVRAPADAHLDLVGSDAALLWAADADRLYFRVQLAATAEHGPGLWPTTWAVLVDTDGDLSNAEHIVTVTGPSAPVDLYANPTGTAGLQPTTWEWSGTVGSRAGGDVAVSLGISGNTAYLDWSVTRADWLALTGVGPAHAMRFAAVSGLSLFTDWDDVAGCDGGAGACSLADALSDAVVIDLDADGLSATQEAVLGTKPTDADSDDDGVLDGDEAINDVDGDGLIGPLDRDSDDDGLFDGLESGVVAPSADTALAAGCFVADADPVSVTNPNLADTDAGGLDDGFEDWNGDGAVGPWETDPNLASDDVDSDGDGIADVLELQGQDGLVVDVDSDGDGVSDATEWLWDDDGDGVPNFLDDDSDGDGIPDAVEGAGDPDGDGVASYLDPDSDGDGVPDEVEGEGDTDGDGTPDFLDDDSDGDGTPDLTEGMGDADCDGVPDYADADDGDGPCGRTDVIDTGADTDAPLDGLPFAYGELTGGACATGPIGGAWWVILLAGLLVARRGEAQEVDAQRFAPDSDGRTFVKLQGGDVLAQGDSSVGAWLGWVNDPFVYRPDDPARDELAVLGTAVGLELAASHGFGPVAVGGSLALYPYARGYLDGGFDHSAGPRLGDLRLAARLPLYDAGEQHLSATLGLRLPTGAGLSWLGSQRARLSLSAAAQRPLGPVTGVLNLGFLTGAAADVGADLRDTARASWGVGVAAPLTPSFSLVSELEGELWLGALGHAAGRPVELLVSGRAKVQRGTLVSVGLGTGLSRGIGAPDARVVLGVQRAPVAESQEEELREIVRVAPPDVATGHVVLRAYAPGGERVPKAEVRVIGTVGVPLQTGNDGLFEADLVPGSYEVSVSAPGWTTAERRVEVLAYQTANVSVFLRPNGVLVDPEAGRIYLHRKVFFELDRADLKIESLELLDELIRTLTEHPEIARLEVEGHTDTQGTRAHNLALSQARAQAVVDYLVREGIDAERLVAKGFGESRPLQEGNTEEVHATNRRVEFHIVPAEVQP